MKINEKGLNLIKNFEGCRLTAYKCPAGILTIGYGHTGSDVKAGMTITKEKANELLRKDLERFEKSVSATVKLPLNENQFSALVSFTYNCGVGNLRTLIKNRNIKQIGDSILKYNKAGGKILSGLVKRRSAEHNLFFS